ncbi:MAG: CRTAC1 family protein, partial [Chitinophagaceae bacterium]
MVENSGIHFRNDVKDSKEDNGFLFRNFYNGGGVATGDINNDGLADVFFTSNQGENKLYLNKGDFKFEDISQQAGLQQEGMWSTGVTMADVNADGWLDIYVCSSGNMKTGKRRNKLYINQQNLSFKEMAADFGLDVSGYCTQASFFDYDLDGDLDMFLINNSPIPFSSLNYANMRDLDISQWQVDDNLKGGGNHLYRNDNGRFTEVTKEAGLHTGLISFGLGVSVSDVNGDGYPDIYVGNDFIEKDYLYLNQQDGTFKDDLENCIKNISMSSMSSDLADINNDGFPDIFTTDMIPDDDYRLKTTGTFDNIDLYQSKQKAGLYHQYVRNCLQVNNGNGTFSEVANYAGVYGTDWSWGAVFLDADNDGLNDIFVCNGIPKDVGDLDFLDFFSNDVYNRLRTTGQRIEIDELLKQIPSTPIVNRAFRNLGDFRFEDAGEAWGFSQPSFSNSVAYADFDNDGDLDLVINNENALAFVYRNQSREKAVNNFISFQLKGKAANPFAIGSKICVYKGDALFFRELSPVRGFQSSVDYRQVIGIGRHEAIDSVVITWADRSKSTYIGLAVNTLHQLTQEESTTNHTSAVESKSHFSLSQQAFISHREDDHLDYYYERNLPSLLSREGPHAAVGDVTGDGLVDV